MTQTEVNKIIQEKVRGGCWHAWRHIGMNAQPFNILMGYTNVCSKCNKQATKRINPDFSKWEHYGPLLDEIRTHDWFEDLAYEDVAYPHRPYETHPIFDEDNILNPARGSLAIAEFVMDNPDLFGKEED